MEARRQRRLKLYSGALKDVKEIDAEEDEWIKEENREDYAMEDLKIEQAKRQTFMSPTWAVPVQPRRICSHRHSRRTTAK